LNPYQREFARDHGALTLDEGLRGADVFIGASTGAVLSQDAVRAMARFPIVFPLATPEPEIGYEAGTGLAARCDRGHRAHAVSERHRRPAQRAIRAQGALARPGHAHHGGHAPRCRRRTRRTGAREVPDEVSRAYGHETFSFGPEYLLPKPIDQRILVREPAAVAARALADGVARHPVDTDRYQESLRVRIGTGARRCAA